MINQTTYFYLPDEGNSITENDINAGAFRITVNGKSYFNRKIKDITIQIKGKVFSASYTSREGRSDILRIGKEAMSLLNIKPGNRIEISRIDFSNFIIEKM